MKKALNKLIFQPICRGIQKIPIKYSKAYVNEKNKIISYTIFIYYPFPSTKIAGNNMKSQEKSFQIPPENLI